MAASVASDRKLWEERGEGVRVGKGQRPLQSWAEMVVEAGVGGDRGLSTQQVGGG